MSKRYNIRWSESDNQELRKAVKNFNAKITRLEKKYPDKIKALPEKVKVSDMKDLIATRQDLKRELNALRRFSRKGAEEFVKVPNNNNNLEITKWQKNEMVRRASVINKRRKKKHEELSAIELQSRGEKLGYTRGQVGMGRADEVALRPLNPFTKGMYYGDMHRKFKTIRKESQSNYFTEKDLTMRKNYTDKLKENFNIHDVEDIIEKIETMPFEEFYRIIITEDPDFEFPYPPDAEQYGQYLSALRTIFLPDKYTKDVEFKIAHPEAYTSKANEGLSQEEKEQRAKEYLKNRNKAKRGKKG